MKKMGMTVNGLMSMYPDAEVIVEGTGPYWLEAELIHTSGFRVNIKCNSEFNVDTRMYGEIETIVLKGEINDG